MMNKVDDSSDDNDDGFFHDIVFIMMLLSLLSRWSDDEAYVWLVAVSVDVAKVTVKCSAPAVHVDDGMLYKSSVSLLPLLCFQVW